MRWDILALKNKVGDKKTEEGGMGDRRRNGNMKIATRDKY